MDIADVEVFGVFLQSLGHACVNLQLIAGEEAAGACSVDPGSWYPAARFRELFEHVVGCFPNPEPLRERIGTEMMKLWYEHGPGRSIIASAVDFLRYQTGSEGYHSLVRGPESNKGAFSLLELDEPRGRAIIRSTTPFDRAMERGVLLGGLKLTGEVGYVKIENTPDASTFHVEFH